MNYRLWGGENGFCYLHTDACVSNWKNKYRINVNWKKENAALWSQTAR